MAGPLDGQVAVVTGGGRGIGRAVVLELAKAGATVVINYTRDQASANALFMEIVHAGGNALVVRADVSDPEQAKQLIETAAESSDHLLEEYLSGDPIPIDELHHVVLDEIRAGRCSEIRVPRSSRSE